MPLDDLSAQFKAHRENLGGRADGAALLDEVLMQPPSGGAHPDVAHTTGDAGNTPIAPASPVSAVASDIGEGIIETPIQVVGGLSDAARETFEALDSVADWLNENVADLTFEGTGIEALDNPLEALANLMPDIDEADSVTGNLVRGVSQFIGGFVGAGKFIKAKGLMGASVKGAVADATVFDPHEERLSNLIESVPELQNPVSDFLAAEPGDSEALGRLKSAAEGLVWAG